MSSRRQHSPEASLCRFAFSDGRRCAMPAHPAFDGLCYSHGTLAPRASREDNLRRELEPLASGDSSAKARSRALRALARAISARRISPERAEVLVRLSRLIESSARFAEESAFQRQSGPAWARLRHFLDGDPPAD